jgi:hypothetical protein
LENVHIWPGEHNKHKMLVNNTLTGRDQLWPNIFLEEISKTLIRIANLTFIFKLCTSQTHVIHTHRHDNGNTHHCTWALRRETKLNTTEKFNT